MTSPRLSPLPWFHSASDACWSPVLFCHRYKPEQWDKQGQNRLIRSETHEVLNKREKLKTKAVKVCFPNCCCDAVVHCSLHQHACDLIWVTFQANNMGQAVSPDILLCWVLVEQRRCGRATTRTLPTSPWQQTAALADEPKESLQK